MLAYAWTTSVKPSEPPKVIIFLGLWAEWLVSYLGQIYFALWDMYFTQSFILVCFCRNLFCSHPF